MKSRYARIVERLKPFGFEAAVLKKEGVVALRYAMDGYLRQSIQVVEQSARHTKVFLSVGYDVLDRMGHDNPRKAPTLPVDGRNIDRAGNVVLPGALLDDYLGWECGEVEAIADVAVKYGLPWLDSRTDPRQIIQFILDDMVAREAAVAKWEAEGAREITLWQHLRRQRKPDPDSRPRPSPPIYQEILANLYFYIGDIKESVKYLEKVCEMNPGWKDTHAKLKDLRASLGQEPA